MKVQKDTITNNKSSANYGLLPFFNLSIIICLVTIDKITKVFQINYFINLGDLGSLSFVQTYNSGTFFGLLPGHGSVIAMIGILCSAAFLFLLSLDLDRTKVFAMDFIIAGSLANFFERIFYGYVTDIVTVQSLVLPAVSINFADMYLLTGFVIILVSFLSTKKTRSFQQ